MIAAPFVSASALTTPARSARRAEITEMMRVAAQGDRVAGGQDHTDSELSTNARVLSWALAIGAGLALACLIAPRLVTLADAAGVRWLS